MRSLLRNEGGGDAHVIPTGDARLVALSIGRDESGVAQDDRGRQFIVPGYVQAFFYGGGVASKLRATDPATAEAPVPGRHY